MIKTDKNKILGHCLLKNKQGLKLDVTIYGGNCLAIMTHTFRNDDGKLTNIVVNFYASEEHLRKIAKEYELTDEYYEISLNFAHKEARILASYWVKEQNIQIYYCK